MKKTMRFLALVAVSVGLLMAGCGKEESSSGNSADNGGGNNGGGNNEGGGGSTTFIEWIDLGLPSGLLWAECNVGATALEEYGNYFAWGETTPKRIYDWSTYLYSEDGEGRLPTLTKYNNSTDYGTVDSLTTLEAVDDAATANMGGGARTPTHDEWQELMNNTNSEWTTLNGVNGRRLTSTINGNSIFLPAASYRTGSEDLIGAGYMGRYWSSSLNADHPPLSLRGAYSFYIYSDGQRMNDDRYRYCGLSVRAVRQN